MRARTLLVACCAVALSCPVAAGAQVPGGGAANPVNAPYAAGVNHAHAAEQFRWGWFGAGRYYPRVSWSRDHNGELMRWSLQQRYGVTPISAAVPR